MYTRMCVYIYIYTHINYYHYYHDHYCYLTSREGGEDDYFLGPGGLKDRPPGSMVFSR